MSSDSSGSSLPPRIGRYEIQAELGRGTMGIVYRAYDPVLERVVALKTIRVAFTVSDADRVEFEQRFFTEARSAARLSHPGIVVVHDVGRDPETGDLFMALEYLEGRTLAQMTEAGHRVGWQETLGILAQLAEALHHAHSRGVVHRDLKPANVMVLATGEAKIMDFGIAKMQDAGSLTSTGQFFGTPLFMSPEQALGEAVDARSDLFSLGSLAYQLLTGSRPFDAESIPRILARVAYETPAPPSHLVPELPKTVDVLLMRSLAKDPGERYTSAEELAEDAREVLEGRSPFNAERTAPPRGSGTVVIAGPGSAAGPPPPATPRRWPRPWLVMALAVLLAALVFETLALRRARSRLAQGPTVADTTAPGQETAPDAETPEPTPTPALLAIDFEHHLKSGKIRVWLDKDLVLDEPLDARVTKKILAFTLRKGHVEETLEVPPGPHEVWVEVSWDDNLKTERIPGVFESGKTRTLDVSVGRIRKDLSLDWK